MGGYSKEKNKGIIKNDGFLGDGNGTRAESGGWIKIEVGNRCVKGFDLKNGFGWNDGNSKNKSHDVEIISENTNTKKDDSEYNYIIINKIVYYIVLEWLGCSLWLGWFCYIWFRT